ncbi:hypothetical protein ACIBEF_00690 [Micromonospora sp. NPDC050795]|uniref:hypothetical protein n=1 Tax=Micromonospora sp. NPDC050795 TaxID=3364282 RepID=UPI0037A80A90
MSYDLRDMPTLTAGFAPFQPGPTSPPPTGPGTGNGERPGPQVTDLTRLQELVDGTDALIDGCRATVTDLRAAMVRTRAARGEVA